MTVPLIRPSISIEARGRLRPILAALEASAARITSAVAAMPHSLKNGDLLKGRTGAERAIEKIINAMPVAPDFREAGLAVWRFLQPVAALPSADPDEPPRPGLLVKAVIAKRRGRPVRCESFGLAVTAHGLGRLLDRSAFRADPIAAVMEAHDAMCVLPTEEGDALFDLRSAALPASGGAFLARPGRFGPGSAPIAICRTWIARDQLRDDQSSTIAAWRELVDPLPGAVVRG